MNVPRFLGVFIKEKDIDMALQVDLKGFKTSKTI